MPYNWTIALVVLFHSVYGLRPVELDVAERLRAEGHSVITPDLYAGQVADTIEDGFALADRVGWQTITGRARAAVDELAGAVVLAGISMGASVAEVFSYPQVGHFFTDSSLPDHDPSAAALVWQRSVVFLGRL